VRSIWKALATVCVGGLVAAIPMVGSSAGATGQQATRTGYWLLAQYPGVSSTTQAPTAATPDLLVHTNTWWYTEGTTKSCGTVRIYGRYRGNGTWAWYFILTTAVGDTILTGDAFLNLYASNGLTKTFHSTIGAGGQYLSPIKYQKDGTGSVYWMEGRVSGSTQNLHNTCHFLAGYLRLGRSHTGSHHTTR